MTLYQIKCDGYILDDMRTDLYIVEQPKITFEKNKVSGLTFIIYKTHPYYDKIKIKQSIIELSKNGKVIFKGRVSEYSQAFDLSMKVDVESVLSFLNDSIFDPFEFQGSPTALLSSVINNHNSQVEEWQRFKIGTVDTLDNNDYINRSSTSYLTSWEVIETRLLTIGGIFRERYESDGTYLDWIEGTQEELNTATQVVEFGENLVDITKTNSAVETYTAVLPLGAKIETEDNSEESTEEETEVTTDVADVRLTIENLPNDATTDIVKWGKYVYSKTAVEQYGWIVAPIEKVTFDDVTIDTNLLTKAKAYLTGTAMLISDTLEINATDLSLTDEEINSFNFLDYIRIKSSVHGVDTTYILTKLELPYKDPQNTKITVGETKLTLTDEQLGNKHQQSDAIEKINSAEIDISENRSNITEVRNQVITQNTQIVNTAENIILSALESYVETSNYNEFKETIEAQLAIMADEIAMNFTDTTQQIDEINGDMQNRFNEFAKYIKFSADGILIGDNETGISLSIDNDMIVFKKDNQQFGWWDGNDFHTGNIVVEVTKRAQFGNFAFIPRSDGSLSFFKISGTEYIDIPLAITVQPVDVTSNAGSTVTFGVTATGNNLTYQWQYSTDGEEWQNADGSTAKTTTLSYAVVASDNGKMFHCVVSNGNNIVISNAATITIGTPQLNITTQPVDVATTEGETVAFNVVANGSNLTYQWQYSTDGTNWTNADNTTATLTLSATTTDNGKMYRCIVSDGTNTITTNAVTLTVEAVNLITPSVFTTDGATANYNNGIITANIDNSGSSGLSWVVWALNNCIVGQTYKLTFNSSHSGWVFVGTADNSSYSLDVAFTAGANTINFTMGANYELFLGTWLETTSTLLISNIEVSEV